MKGENVMNKAARNKWITQILKDNPKIKTRKQAGEILDIHLKYLNTKQTETEKQINSIFNQLINGGE